MCNCGKGAGKRKYEVTTKAGERKTVDTLQAAMNLVRAKGGSYQIVRV